MTRALSGFFSCCARAWRERICSRRLLRAVAGEESLELGWESEAKPVKIGAESSSCCLISCFSRLAASRTAFWVSRFLFGAKIGSDGERVESFRGLAVFKPGGEGIGGLERLGALCFEGELLGDVVGVAGFAAGLHGLETEPGGPGVEEVGGGPLVRSHRSGERKMNRWKGYWRNSSRAVISP